MGEKWLCLIKEGESWCLEKTGNISIETSLKKALSHYNGGAYCKLLTE